MSTHTLISPYINRFVNLIHQNATAKRELSCTGGRVKVNILHDLGEVEDTLPKLSEKAQSDAEKAKLKFIEDKVLAQEASALYKQKTQAAEVQASRDKKEAEKAECIAQQARQELFQ